MRTIRDLDPRGKRILTRVDYNVPLTTRGEIADQGRIAESIPTLKYLLDRGGRVVLMSHLGRPKGITPTLSLQPEVGVLSELLERKVAFSTTTVGPDAEKAAKDLHDGEVLLLENLRFDDREEKNDPGFAASLARLADVFVQEAFGSLHRAHASTVKIAKLLPTYAGFLVEREVRELTRILVAPEKPFVVVIGGAKVEDKLPLLENLLTRVDTILIGGAMAIAIMNPHLANGGGLKVGVTGLFARAEKAGVKVVLPLDFALQRSGDGSTAFSEGTIVPDGYAALDIGPRTIELFKRELAPSRTVFVNGPLGKAEMPEFSRGTREVIGHLRTLKGTHILAGGDSASVVKNLGLASSFSYISTGGGAALEFLEGLRLPGLEVIPE